MTDTERDNFLTLISMSAASSAGSSDGCDIRQQSLYTFIPSWESIVVTIKLITQATKTQQTQEFVMLYYCYYTGYNFSGDLYKPVGILDCSLGN